MTEGRARKESGESGERPTRAVHPNSLKNLKRGGSPGRPQGLARAVRADTEDGRVLAHLMVKIMRGRRVLVGGQVRVPSLAERMKACDWLANHGFGRPSTMAELLMDPTEHRRG